MKKLENNLTISEVEEHVNVFFESHIDTIPSNHLYSSMCAEMILGQHLLKAFQILDSQMPFGVN